MLRIAALVLCAAPLGAQLLTPAWVELGAGGRAWARVVVAPGAGCPAAEVDGKSVTLQVRANPPRGFPSVCEMAVPEGATQASVGSQKLALPRKDPRTIVVIGDTGCRISVPEDGSKKARIQNCSTDWPFSSVAGQAAESKPDLVIHVGDYLYRESPCPDPSACGGSPSGDRWETWDADFFAPAAKLLAAAPWIFVRGNHEDCERAWRGWFYLLDSGAKMVSACEENTPAYLVKLSQFEAAVVDSAIADDDKAKPKLVDLYAAQLSKLGAKHAWIVTHRPFWGEKAGKSGTLTTINETLRAAWKQAAPKGIDLIASGHTHIFEILSFSDGRPPQLVAGDGGTQLGTPIEQGLAGTGVSGGAKIVSGDAESEFGFARLERSANGWTLSLITNAGKTRVQCSVEKSAVDCKRPK